MRSKNTVFLIENKNNKYIDYHSRMIYSFELSSGTVQLEKQIVHQFSPKALAKHIAYLPQRLPEAVDFYTRELVMLGRFPWQKWLQIVSSSRLMTSALATISYPQYTYGEPFYTNLTLRYEF